MQSNRNTFYRAIELSVLAKMENRLSLLEEKSLSNQITIHRLNERKKRLYHSRYISADALESITVKISHAELELQILSRELVFTRDTLMKEFSNWKNELLNFSDALHQIGGLLNQYLATQSSETQKIYGIAEDALVEAALIQNLFGVKNLDYINAWVNLVNTFSSQNIKTKDFAPTAAVQSYEVVALAYQMYSKKINLVTCVEELSSHSQADVNIEIQAALKIAKEAMEGIENISRQYKWDAFFNAYNPLASTEISAAGLEQPKLK